ncbi:RNA polymerase sigma factor SigZ [Bacteroidota bacterium]
MDYSIEKIWKEFHDGLKHFIRTRVNNEYCVDEILQEVFIKIHNKIDTLNDKEKITSWIFQITRNSIIDCYREKNLTGDLNENILAQDEVETDPHKKFLEGIPELIDKLPPIYKEALIKTEYEGLTQKQYAEQSGITLPGAKSRVQRARGLLKDMIMQCCHFEFDRYGKIIDYHSHTCCCCTPEARSE